VTLYEDVVEPLRIRGYAAVFDTVYPIDGGSAWERVAPGAFRLGARSVFLAFGHDHGRRYAWTADKSLALWQDAHGLAFEALAPSNATGRGLVAGVRRGEFRHASVCFTAREVELVVERGREIEVVHRAEISEISLTDAAANPATCVWLDCEDPEELPPHVALASARWSVGRMQASLAAARRPGARARATTAAGLARSPARWEARARAAKPACPASVVAVLDRYYPRGRG
jgi:HK97 family phage prohead protease